MDCNIELRNHLCNHFSAERIGKLAYLRFFGAQSMEHKVGWTFIKKILRQLHFLGWPRVPTESKGISLISSSAKGISPRSRLLQDFCTKVWGEERCKILCPAADRKNVSGIQKNESKTDQKKKYPKRDPKSIYYWNQKMISSRNCAGDVYLCVFLSIKGSKKNIQLHSAGKKVAHLVCHPWCEALKVAPGALKTAILHKRHLLSLLVSHKKCIFTFVDLVGSGSL